MALNSDELTTGEAAQHLRVSVGTLRRWAQDGRIRHSVLPSGRMRFERADLDAAILQVEATNARKSA